MHRFTLTALLALTIVCGGCASTNSGRVASSEPKPVLLDNTHIFTHYSPTLDHTYQMRVALPGSYSWKESATYPLIIKLDGQWDYPLAVSVSNGIVFDGQMPEAVIVGVDWGNVEGDIHAIRARDLLPTPHPRYPEGGHAKTFLDVLVNELIPELENRFRLNGERVLIGGSWSAVFATYALLEQPQEFSGAIAIAGDYDTASEVLGQQIHALENTTALDGKRLYLGVGDWDLMAPRVASLAREMEEAELPGLRLHFDRLKGFGHSGMNTPGYAAGYQHMFRRVSKTLPPAKLKGLAAIYKNQDAQPSILEFVAKADGLSARTPDGITIPLWALSETEFYNPGMHFNVRFEKNKAYVERLFSLHEYERSE